MLKSLLPSRRIPSADFQMLTGHTESAPNGKENYPQVPSASDPKPPRAEKSKKRKAKEQPVDGSMTSEEFERLMDALQVPDNMREKLATMDMSVKLAFLKSSKEMQILKPGAAPFTPRGLRKAHSSESLSTPRSATKYASEGFALPSAFDRPPLLGTHGRGVSYSATNPASVFPQEPVSKASKEKRKNAAVSPAKWCQILMSVPTIQLEVETVKKLRLLLRNEPASWTQEFLQEGGYPALLARLKEILEVEWREEQHDDQILHELLRCFKALSTSAVGCAALRSYSPTPYVQLMSLLYSDKRPGDVATRQLMVELLHNLFELYPPSSLPMLGSPISAVYTYGRARTPSTLWERDLIAPVSSSLARLPAPHTTIFSFIRSLLLTPAPPPSEPTGPTVEPHEFIEHLHRPRVYKSYMEEFNNICRDYFWVFCHPNNTIWNLDEIDEAKVEKPRAPGGMTGGVEFEAMTYMTTHFKFINALALAAEEQNLPPENELSALQFHTDMFLSGIERIILMGRKASTTYYPTLHLEISRYVAAAGRAGFEIPWAVSRLVGSPPSSVRKHVPRKPRAYTPTHLGRGTASVPASPTKSKPSAAALPAVRKVTPMFG